MATHQPTHNQPENWKPVVGYEGLYEVSDLGNVRSVDRTVWHSRGFTMTLKGKLLAQGPRRGYLRVCLTKDGKGKHISVHKLVLEAFVGERPEGQDICHNNGNRTDNRLTNLRYDTKSGNAKDMVKHGTHNLGRREKCPRGHSLTAPNLMKSQTKAGSRSCWACNRTHKYVHRHPELRGKFQQISDIYYEKILEGIPPGAHITITTEQP